MTDINLFRAKSKDEKNYLLKDHLRETILRASQLRNFISQNESAVRYKFDGAFFESLIIACFLHDLGKIGWKFQLRLYDESEKKYDDKSKRYVNNELNQLKEFFKDSTKVDIKDHEVTSLIYSLIFIENDEWDKKIRTAILLHHYNEFYTNRAINARYLFDDYPDLETYIKFLIENKEDIRDLLLGLIQYSVDTIKDSFVENTLKKLLFRLKNDDFIEELERIVDSINDGFGISEVLQLFDIPDKDEESSYSFFVFLGCLRRCDYSASGDVKIEGAQNLREVFEDLDERIKKAIDKKEIWQEKVLMQELAQQKEGNLVLVAPTGSGKTEFALLWAKKMGKKLVYTLPLRVALNDLYWRFRAEENGYFNKEFVEILHSTSFIEYLKEKDGERLNVDEKQTTAKLFSSPVLLTTPDQVFLSSLKYYGFDKLVSIYPLSTIVIDEIQAYKPEMAAIIIKTVKIIRALGGNLLVITATFPPYFEEFFKNEEFRIIDIGIKEKNDADIKNRNLKRHKIRLIKKCLFEYKNNGKGENNLDTNDQSFDDIKQILREYKNKNIMIIVNNVGKAVELYKRIEDKTNQEDPEERLNLYLLHSRLIEKEKSRRIEKIKNKLESFKEHKEKGRLVVIATQIVEASVDVDFDILITEISPIDSQIQRWGRIYRNRCEDYKCDVPNIFIFTEVDKGTGAIYDTRVIEKTKEVLEEYEDKSLDHKDEREIIKRTFEKRIDGRSLKDVFVDDINNNLEWLNYYSVEKRSEAQKIFRNIAGEQVVIPDLMQESDDSVERELYNILRNPEKRKLSWDEIIRDIKNETNKNVEKWDIMGKIYGYSIGLPEFAIGKSEYTRNRILENESFKGFSIIKREIIDSQKDKKKKLEEIEKYGINKIENIVDIDQEEISQNENIVYHRTIF